MKRKKTPLWMIDWIMLHRWRKQLITCRRQSEQAVLLQEQQPGLQWLVRLGCLLGL